MIDRDVINQLIDAGAFYKRSKRFGDDWFIPRTKSNPVRELLPNEVDYLLTHYPEMAKYL